jgi:hypothetical protein
VHREDDEHTSLINLKHHCDWRHGGKIIRSQSAPPSAE